MSKAKYTHEEFLEVVRQNKPDVEILDGEYINIKSRFTARHNKCGYVWETDAEHLVKPTGCPKCSNAVRYTDDEVKNIVKEIRPNIEVLGKYKSNQSGLLCRCKIDGYEWSPTLGNLRVAGCPVCSNKVIIPGYNDFNTKHPDLVKYLLNEKDGTKVSPCNSTKKAACKCPDCGHIQSVLYSNLARVGFSCQRCGDNISYPNKFIREVMRQLLGENYICEYSDDWCNGYYYDCYFEINNSKYVVEMDGSFHYTDNNLNNKTVEDQKMIDNHKDYLTKSNNVEMIRINSQKSDVDFLKINIEKSILSIIFDLSTINWALCDEFAVSNYTKYCCEYYQKFKQEKSLKEIANDLKISNTTLRSYIKTGNKFGWCSTSHEELVSLSLKHRKYSGQKRIRIISDDGKQKDCNSIRDCMRYLNSSGIKISDYIISNRLNKNNGNYQFGKFYLEYIT